MSTVYLNGRPVDFDACVNLMDDDLREEVHSSFEYDSDQEFLDLYMLRHFESFGEVFRIV